MKRFSIRQSGLVAFLACTLLSARGEEGAGQPALVVPDLVEQLNEAFVRVAEESSKAVVVIRVAHSRSPVKLEVSDDSFWDAMPRDFRRKFEPDSGSGEPSPEFDGQGSGVVIRKQGFILTNRHVIDGADRIQVRFADGREAEARIQGVDVQSDVAIIKVDHMDRLEVARLGDSEKVRVGEFAIAIGAPFELDYSVTFGHVSAKGRSYIIPDPTLDQDFIQTDANINPGNSGGPLVNIRGEVIGINTLIRGMRTGIGFAVPINMAREVADQLIDTGRFTRAWLGIGIRALRSDPEFLAMVDDIDEGVIVTEVLPTGPAAKSDLKPADVILAVDGAEVRTEQELKNLVRSKKIGEPIRLKVHRVGRTLDLTVHPEAWPDEDVLASQPVPVEVKEPENRMGLTVRAATSDLAKELGVEYSKGLIVTEVEPGSPASAKGIRVGDVITDVDRHSVRTAEEFKKAMAKGDPHQGIILNFTSRGTSKFEILRD